MNPLILRAGEGQCAEGEGAGRGAAADPRGGQRRLAGQDSKDLPAARADHRPVPRHMVPAHAAGARLPTEAPRPRPATRGQLVGVRLVRLFLLLLLRYDMYGENDTVSVGVHRS